MKTFILLHGANQGGWIWSETVSHMQEYRVITPTFTGMGERKHLLSKAITAQTHIDDIINLVHYENLNEIILVGYSYAGLILPAIHEALFPKVKKLIFLDSFIPEAGKNGLALLEKKYQDKWQQTAQLEGNGWKMLPSETLLNLWGVSDEVLKKTLLPQLTNFSLNFLKTPLFFSKYFEQANKAYIHCKKISYFNKIMSPFYKKAKNAGWDCYEINTTHLPMLTKAQELANLLVKIGYLC